MTRVLLTKGADRKIIDLCGGESAEGRVIGDASSSDIRNLPFSPTPCGFPNDDGGGWIFDVKL